MPPKPGRPCRKPGRPCRKPGCPHLANSQTGYCETHEQQAKRQADTQRPNANQRGYNYRWQQYVKQYLKEHPLCKICLDKKPPVIEASQCVDHIIPHKGDYKLFWDPNNHQAASLACHNAKTAKEDGAFGNPIHSKAPQG